MAQDRGQWSSKIGFIFAAAGSAIGLGNIWRFPYIVGENGGAAFVVLYIFFVFAIGYPYMLAELSIGRAGRLNPVGAIRKLSKKRGWSLAGYLGVFTGLGILSFYGVIAGWTFGYVFNMAFGANVGFVDFVSNEWLVLALFALFLIFTTMIVYGGVEAGIERWSKILMPLLFVLMIGLIIYANTLDGADKGLSFYLNPDFTKITGSTVLAALGQAFFSLSLGMGLMITYGSYVDKSDNMTSSAFYIVLFDTMVAIMAGLIIFPALFAMGENPSSGPALIFVVFPKLFMQMPGGLIVGTLFFILLSVAALTSTISLLEAPTSFAVDQMKSNRKKAVWIVALVAFIIGIPSALSQGSSEYFSNFGLLPKYLCDADFLSQISFVFGDFSLAFGALVTSLFVGAGWGANKAAAEIEIAAPNFKSFKGAWQVIIKYVAPILIFVILLNLFGVFE